MFYKPILLCGAIIISVFIQCHINTSTKTDPLHVLHTMQCASTQYSSPGPQWGMTKLIYCKRHIHDGTQHSQWALTQCCYLVTALGSRGNFLTTISRTLLAMILTNLSVQTNWFWFFWNLQIFSFPQNNYIINYSVLRQLCRIFGLIFLHWSNYNNI